MIVCPYNESFLLLVLQTDHSRIAGLLAAHWGNDKFASLNPYASMALQAVRESPELWRHSNKKIGPERLAVDVGQPHGEVFMTLRNMKPSFESKRRENRHVRWILMAFIQFILLGMVLSAVSLAATPAPNKVTIAYPTLTPICGRAMDGKGNWCV